MTCIVEEGNVCASHKRFKVVSPIAVTIIGIVLGSKNEDSLSKRNLILILEVYPIIDAVSQAEERHHAEAFEAHRLLEVVAVGNICARVDARIGVTRARGKWLSGDDNVT